ncbi:hypothetical protein PanWU01x14_119150 [Parasponia andersonii]|uniref:Uncharacterized protein n=1 Tax=Parasponia andersonii TaxID=3476 RepID=A0A2P5CW07_PARAD|nr:hypothetical protein PanWU01x14_119150 [Parasponia andersonii]
MIKDDEGAVFTTKEDVGMTFTKKLSKIFTVEPTSFPVTPDDLILSFITLEESLVLETIPSFKHIKEVLFSMNPWKVLGLDGFSRTIGNSVYRCPSSCQ